MDRNSLGSWHVTKYQHHLKTREEDEVARELALTVRVNGEEFATIVCSPVNLKELVVGFLASEGVILSYQEVISLLIDEDQGFAHVELTSSFTPEEKSSKRFIGSCCGKSREFYFQSDAKTAKTITSEATISHTQVYALMEQFHKEAETFKRSGAVHQAAIADNQGMLAAFTDIGRHNALDKLYGYLLIHKMPRKNKLILFSGRISSEVLLKVSKIGTGILLSKSAPTDLALRLADDLNITAIGFVRDKRMNVYTHEERVKEAELEQQEEL